MIATASAPARLIGRAAELEILSGLLDRVAEQGGALVICGEAGIGKTALLDYLADGASAFVVARAAGVESEMELAFAGLHQLCAPFLDRIERLSDSQRGALEAAFGLRVEAAPDRFLVGLGVLRLLADVAEEQPLLCVVDDAQWLDLASAQALAFVARRLLAEPVVMLFAAREVGDDFRGLPEIVVGGLRDTEARELLSSVVRGRLDERVRERIVAETRGNPLALLELPRERSPAELAGGFGISAAISDGHSLSRRIEESFVLRLESLPADTQLVLLVAAAEPVGDPALLWGAAGRLGISYEAVVPATGAELLDVSSRVQFRHPLVRSAIYRTASLADRQQVHRALADVTDPKVDPDRRAWHLAQAAAGPDEEVAEALERSAGRARARGGFAAEAAFLERAVGLTPDAGVRTRRALAAARAKLEVAAPDAASELLAIAEMGPLDELHRARVERQRVQIAFARTGAADVPGLAIGPRAPALLLDAAKRLKPLDAELARETYLETLIVAMLAGRANGGCGVLEAGEAARAAPTGPQPPGPIDLLLDGLTARFTEPYAAAVPPLRKALDALAGRDGRGDDDIGWIWFACPVQPEPLAPDLWDDETWHELAARAVRITRDAGALAVLPNALTYRACVHVVAGEFAAASALIEEAYAISEATGNAPLRYPSLLLAAWRGQEAEAMNVIEAGIGDATARGLGRAIGFAQYVTAVLHNGLGRYREALAAAQGACAHDDLGLYGWALTELVEAGVRSNSTEVACDALRQLAERTRATGTDWALGIEARSRALLSEGEEADRLYREAIERLGRTRIRVELTRAHLLYGEWLRREKRRVHAREQLRVAYDAFASMGAEGFAERARRELLATGEKVRKRADDTRGELTPQEDQIARLACGGLSNSEIAAGLFISPRTVEYHLHKVFTKLDISARNQLERALEGERSAAIAV